MIVYCCCLILVQLQSNVHFRMTVEDFPVSDNRIYMSIFKLSLSKLSLMVLPFSRLQHNNFTYPVINGTFRLPYKTNHRIPGQVDFSIDLLISRKVPKSTRSEDPLVFPVLFSLLCVYKMLARPILRLCLFFTCTWSTCTFTLYDSS